MSDMPTPDKTSPKPFVFVLMPFDSAFDDVYILGIKAAAKEIGAYAERVDEQQYAEGMLDRIFNQINKADVIVADMTKRNPNVFYEVGYAHALNKLVILLTQEAGDIPFDLKHRPHIVYGGRIDDLKKTLKARLRWAISEGLRREGTSADTISVSIAGRDLASDVANPSNVIDVWGSIQEGASSGEILVRFAVRNDAAASSAPITHVYIFGAPDSPVFPISSLNSDKVPVGDRSRSRLAYPARPADTVDGLTEQFHMKGEIPSIPPGGLETGLITFRFVGTAVPMLGRFRLRLLSAAGRYEFQFTVMLNELKIQRRPTLSKALAVEAPPPSSPAPQKKAKARKRRPPNSR
jgi:hypothetical protein